MWTLGAGWGKTVSCKTQQEKYTISGGEATSSSSASHSLLLTKLNVVPVGKGVLFSGPISITLVKTMKGGFGAESQ